MGIRAYHETDLEACVEIVDATWQFRRLLPPRALGDFALRRYVGGSLAGSDGAWVVDDDSGVRGFIFADSGHGEHFQNDHSGWRGGLRTVMALLRLPGVGLGQKLGWLRSVRGHDVNLARVVPDADGEITLFALDPEARGRGYGRALMDHCLGELRRKGTRSVWLETDTGSSWGFYEHYGFERGGSFRSPMNERFIGGEDEVSFVYRLALD